MLEGDCQTVNHRELLQLCVLRFGLLQEEKPSRFLVAERDRMIAPETQRFIAHRAGSHILAMELDHTPLASAPDRVAAIITEAVDAVTQESALDPHRIGRRA